MATFWRRRGRPPHPEILTPSEQRVLELIREGKTNSEIAYELSISISGVKWHVSNMLGKLGVSDRHQLAAWRGPVGSPGSRTGTAGIAGWLGWKAAVGAAGGLAVTGAIVAAALVGAADEAPPPAVVATAVPPQPPTTFVATVEFADALSTKVRLELQLASPPTDDYMLSIEDGFAIYADGDRSKDYAPTMRLMEGGRGRSDGGTFAIEFDPVPADTQFIDVELNGNLRRVAMSQAEADRQKTPGAQYFPAVPPGTVARAAVVRDPVEVDLTDRAPREFDSGLGWKYVFERVVATSTRIEVTYHVEGQAAGRTASQPRKRREVDGELRFGPESDKIIVFLPRDRPTVRFAAGPESRWVAEPLRAEFTRSSSGWSDWRGQYGSGPLVATIADGPGIMVSIPTTVNILGQPDGVTLSDDRGRVYPKVEASAGPDMQQIKFQGPLDPAAATVTLSVDGYWVPETREWTVEIPVQ